MSRKGLDSNLPDVDDRVILDGNSIVKDLLPNNVPIVRWVGADNVQQLLDVDRLQLVIVVGHVPLLHEVGDVGVALPKTHSIIAFPQYLNIFGWSGGKF